MHSDFAAFGIIVDLAPPQAGDTLYSRLLRSRVILIKDMVDPDEIDPYRPPLYKFPGGTYSPEKDGGGQDHQNVMQTVVREVKEEISLGADQVQFTGNPVMQCVESVSARGARRAHDRHFILGALNVRLEDVPQIGRDEDDRDYHVSTALTVDQVVGEKTPEILPHHRMALVHILSQVEEYETAHARNKKSA